MNDIFVSTSNYEKFKSVGEDLLKSSVGLDMAVVVGRAGRGKTTAAERFATMNGKAIYIRYQEWLTHVGLLREIAFEISGTRPHTTHTCLEIIDGEFSQTRRLVLIDEADLMSLKHINTLRGLHDRYHVPVILIGEKLLLNKIAQERRIKSRVRQELEFEPVNTVDVVLYYKQALAQEINSQLAASLAKHAEGDFRFVVKDALQLERLMEVNGLKKISDTLINEVCK